MFVSLQISYLKTRKRNSAPSAISQWVGLGVILFFIGSDFLLRGDLYDEIVILELSQQTDVTESDCQRLGLTHPICRLNASDKAQTLNSMRMDASRRTMGILLCTFPSIAWFWFIVGGVGHGVIFQMLLKRAD